MPTKHRTSYAISAGRRPVAVRQAWTPGEALTEYLRGLGCRNHEFTRMQPDKLSWRGAIFTATPIADQ